MVDLVYVKIIKNKQQTRGCESADAGREDVDRRGRWTAVTYVRTLREGDDNKNGDPCQLSNTNEDEEKYYEDCYTAAKHCPGRRYAHT